MGFGMKFQIELDIAEGSVDKQRIEQHLRKEAVLTLFAERQIPAGRAARELGLGRIDFMELLKQRGIPYVIYKAEDWDSDGKAIEEFDRRRR